MQRKSSGLWRRAGKGDEGLHEGRKCHPGRLEDGLAAGLTLSARCLAISCALWVGPWSAR